MDRAASIAIEQDFGPRQPVHFGAPMAQREAWTVGSFVGDTRRGGSCNVDRLSMIPHCNGTHTESAGHILRELLPISRALAGELLLARLVTVAATDAAATTEARHPAMAAPDQVITASAIRAALESGDCGEAARAATALVLRTQPNDRAKTERDWSTGPVPPYFTAAAIEAVLAAGFDHLLVDLPSIDRSADGGLMQNHCLFWETDPETRRAGNPAALRRTITEMVFVPDAVADGLYVLDLQIPPFATDAAPSRPVLFPLEPDTG